MHEHKYRRPAYRQTAWCVQGKRQFPYWSCNLRQNHLNIAFYSNFCVTEVASEVKIYHIWIEFTPTPAEWKFMFLVFSKIWSSFVWTDDKSSPLLTPNFDSTHSNIPPLISSFVIAFPSQAPFKMGSDFDAGYQPCRYKWLAEAVFVRHRSLYSHHCHHEPRTNCLDTQEFSTSLK